MTITNEMLNRAKAYANDPYREYEKYGIRVQETAFIEGEVITDVSYVWIDGECTGEELSGLCAIDATFNGKPQDYYGEHGAIIAGNEYEYGEDPGEIIIANPIVIDVLS